MTEKCPASVEVEIFGRKGRLYCEFETRHNMHRFTLKARDQEKRETEISLTWIDGDEASSTEIPLPRPKVEARPAPSEKEAAKRYCKDCKNILMPTSDGSKKCQNKHCSSYGKAATTEERQRATGKLAKRRYCSKCERLLEVVSDGERCRNVACPEYGKVIRVEQVREEAMAMPETLDPRKGSTQALTSDESRICKDCNELKCLSFTSEDRTERAWMCCNPKCLKGSNNLLIL